MSLDWIINPILCQGQIASAAISPNEPLLPLQSRIAFRASLLFDAWQTYACDGRQMSCDEIDRMDEFKAQFLDGSLSEDSLRRLVEDFGDFIPTFLSHGPVDVSERALNWTRQDANKPMHGSAEADRI